MRVPPLWFLMAVIFTVGNGCREREKPRNRWDETDGGIVRRPECDTAGGDCLMSCVKRNASPACTRCCLDQGYVCNTGHKPDFESCEGSR